MVSVLTKHPYQVVRERKFSSETLVFINGNHMGPIKDGTSREHTWAQNFSLSQKNYQEGFLSTHVDSYERRGEGFSEDHR